MGITIRDLAQQVGWRGPAMHRTAEPSGISTLPVIDNASRISNRGNMRTSIDCYVSGQYVQRNGKVMEVTQRYTMFVAYDGESQQATMTQVRDQIMKDFQEKYGRTFNVTNVWVQPLGAPVETRSMDPEQYYGGTPQFKEMTKYEKYRYEIGTQKEISKTNIQSIRKRYGYKR